MVRVHYRALRLRRQLRVDQSTFRHNKSQLSSVFKCNPKSSSQDLKYRISLVYDIF